MKNPRFITMQSLTRKERDAFIARNNARADEIVQVGGVWNTWNSLRAVEVEPVDVYKNPVTGIKSVIVKAVTGKPFKTKNEYGGGTHRTATAYVWPEDLWQNETASATTEAAPTNERI